MGNGSAKATLLKVPNAGHMPYVVQPGIVWSAVEKFFARRCSGRGYGAAFCSHSKGERTTATSDARW